jgi:hypothetical protein
VFYKKKQLRDWLLPMLMNGQLGLPDVNKELTVVFGSMQPKIHFGVVSFAGLPYYDPDPPHKYFI